MAENVSAGMSDGYRVVLCVFTDKMKSAVVAKLANHCSFLYADALKQMQADAVKSLWPKVMIARVFTVLHTAAFVFLLRD